MRLRIVEFADELKNYKYFEGEKIIALNPCSQSFFKKRKIDFENSLNFFGINGHVSVLNQSKKVMDIVKEKFNYIDKNGVNLSYVEGFNTYLTFYLRYILILLFIVDKVIKKYNPEEIIVPESTSIKNFGFYCSQNDRLLGYIVKKYVSANNLKIKILEEKVSKKIYKINFNFFKNISKIFIFNFSNIIFKYFFNKKNIYIAINDSNNFSNVISKIKEQDAKLKPIFLSLSNNGLKKYSKDILKGNAFNLFFNNAIKNNKESNDIEKSIRDFNINLSNGNKTLNEINYLKVDLIDELCTFASSVITKALKELNAQINLLQKIIKICQPNFMISQHTHLLGCAFGEFGKKYNIPTMVISHGSHSSTDSENGKYESLNLANNMINKNFPYIAAQTPQMLKFLKENQYKEEQIIITEPLLYNKFYNSELKQNEIKKKLFGENKGKKIILHAGTPKMRGNNRLYIYETVDEYIKNINDMISVFNKKKNIFFVIKYRKNPRIALKDFKELINESENCKIFSEGNLSDFLITADLMISYSSTAIDEAIYNKIPTVLYDPDNKYSHIKETKKMTKDFDLNDGIIYISKLKELELNIDKIIENSKNIKEKDFIWQRYIFNEENKKKWLSHLNK